MATKLAPIHQTRCDLEVESDQLGLRLGVEVAVYAAAS